MATVVPPPSKRQRREDLERHRFQQDVTAPTGPAGSFKARFLDSDGNQTGVVEVPLADASEKNLSLLLNTLMSRVCVFCTNSPKLNIDSRANNSTRRGKILYLIDFEYISPIAISLLTSIQPIYYNFFAAMA